MQKPPLEDALFLSTVHFKSNISTLIDQMGQVARPFLAKQSTSATPSPVAFTWNCEWDTMSNGPWRLK